MIPAECELASEDKTVYCVSQSAQYQLYNNYQHNLAEQPQHKASQYEDLMQYN